MFREAVQEHIVPQLDNLAQCQCYYMHSHIKTLDLCTQHRDISKHSDHAVLLLLPEAPLHTVPRNTHSSVHTRSRSHQPCSLFESLLSPFEKIMVSVSFGKLKSTHCEETAKNNTHTHTSTPTYIHTSEHTDSQNTQMNDITVLFVLWRRNDRASPFALFFSPSLALPLAHMRTRTHARTRTCTHTHLFSITKESMRIALAFCGFSHDQYTSLWISASVLQCRRAGG